MSPFDLKGVPFLHLYWALLAIAIVAGFLIPRWPRPDGQRWVSVDVDQLAYLAGGPARFGDAIVARLLALRALVMTGKDQFDVTPGHGARSAAEAQILALPAPISWKLLQRTLKSCAAPIEHKLVLAELLMGPALTRQMRAWQTSPYVLLLIFGGIKWGFGVSRGRPVGYLTALLILTLLLAIVRWAVIDRRTRAAIERLNDARTQSARLRRAPTEAETDRAVALFGTAVLAGSAWAGFHQLRHSSGSDGGFSGGSDGGSGGGDGGGGGGCGGCGGH